MLGHFFSQKRDSNRHLTSTFKNQRSVPSDNDIVRRFNDDVWSVILSYVEDSIGLVEKYTYYDDGEGYYEPPIERIAFRPIIKDPYFTWTSDPSLFKLCILSPHMAKQIDSNKDSNQAFGYLAHSYAVKKYINRILEDIYPIERLDISSYEIESRLNKMRNRKCNALSFGIWLGLAVLSVYLIIFAFTSERLGPKEITAEVFGILLAPILGGLLITQGIYCAMDPGEPLLYGCNPFKKANIEDFYKQKVGSYSLVDVVPRLQNGERNLKICEVFADFLGVSSIAIRDYKVKDILAGIELKYNAAVKNWNQANPGNSEDVSEIINSKIQFFKERSNKKPVSEVKIEVLDPEEEKHLSQLG